MTGDFSYPYLTANGPELQSPNPACMAAADGMGKKTFAVFGPFRLTSL